MQDRPIVWLGSVLWDVVNNCGGKTGKIETFSEVDGRFKEHVEVDVMDMECGVLFVAMRPVIDWATLLCAENKVLKGP